MRSVCRSSGSRCDCRRSSPSASEPRRSTRNGGKRTKRGSRPDELESGSSKPDHAVQVVQHTKQASLTRTEIGARMAALGHRGVAMGARSAATSARRHVCPEPKTVTGQAAQGGTHASDSREARTRVSNPCAPSSQETEDLGTRGTCRTFSVQDSSAVLRSVFSEKDSASRSASLQDEATAQTLEHRPSRPRLCGATARSPGGRRVAKADYAEIHASKTRGSRPSHLKGSRCAE